MYEKCDGNRISFKTGRVFNCEKGWIYVLEYGHLSGERYICDKCKGLGKVLKNK